MKKNKFRGRFMKFIDKTSSVTPKEENGKYIYPKIKLRVKISSEIPLTHRLYWWWYNIKFWQQQLLEELCFLLSLL